MFWHQIVVFYSISPSRNPFILEWRKKYVFLQNKTKQRLLSKRFNQYRESSFLRSAIFINDKVNITSSQEKNISFLYTLYSQFRHKKNNGRSSTWVEERLRFGKMIHVLRFKMSHFEPLCFRLLCKYLHYFDLSATIFTLTISDYQILRKLYTTLQFDHFTQYPKTKANPLTKNTNSSSLCKSLIYSYYVIQATQSEPHTLVVHLTL